MTRGWYSNERTVSAYRHARSILRAKGNDEVSLLQGREELRDRAYPFYRGIRPDLPDNLGPLVPFRKVIYLRD